MSAGAGVPKDAFLSSDFDKNPNVPAFISKAPWYLDTGAGEGSLDHQKNPVKGKAAATLDDWYDRGRTAGPAATRYRKGACENCGAMSHKTRDCMERPRKRGARWTNKDIMPDEVLQDLSGKEYGFDAKRDRWNGYDPRTHVNAVARFEALEEERRRLREEELNKQVQSKGNAEPKKKRVHHDSDFDSSDEDDDDEDEDQTAGVGPQGGLNVRNLRIREDRAKYLNNLNPESAHYDPKTRSMRDISLDGTDTTDAFERAKGNSVEPQKLQMFAWQAEQRGDTMLHAQANPTVNEIQYREYQKKKEQQSAEVKSSILDRYGGAEHLQSLPDELRSGQTEAYVEYSRTGQVVRGQERAKPRSRYEEDGAPPRELDLLTQYMKTIIRLCGARGMTGAQRRGAMLAATTLYRGHTAPVPQASKPTTLQPSRRCIIDGHISILRLFSVRDACGRLSRWHRSAPCVAL